jgi:hypothetical protein
MDIEKSQTRSPFAGGPETIEETLPNGTKQITVLPKAITPLRAKLADWLSNLMTGTAFCGAVYSATLIGDAPAWQFAALLGAPFAALPFMRMGLYHAFQKKARVVFTPETFTAHKLFCPKSFDRNMPHSFAIYYHDKKDREAEIIADKVSARAGRWWAFFPPKKYFGKSYYLSFEYMGQRNDLMLVYKYKKAQEILARLNACDEVMNGYHCKGRGQALKPQDEWTPQAGSLEDSAQFGSA